MRPGNSVKDFITTQKFYKKIEPKGFRFFCVSCKLERRQAPPARMGSPKFFAQVILTTAFLTLLTYPWMQFKGAFAWFIPVGFGLEILYRLKMRSSLICPECRFDPILYLSDRKAAVSQVEQSWRKKFESAGIPYPEKSQVYRRGRSALDLTSASSVNQGHGNQ